MDHAYFKPGYSGKGWMRITKNGHACTILRDIANVSERLLIKMQDIIWNSMQKNNERGSLIVICPPTNAVSWFFDMPPDVGKQTQ